jgi:hypothetical protein
MRLHESMKPLGNERGGRAPRRVFRRFMPSIRATDGINPFHSFSQWRQSFP